MNEGTNPNKQKLLSIFDRFFDLLWEKNAIESDYLSYDILDRIETSDWLPLADEIVSGQLREVLNGINQFQTKINHLDAWARLLQELPESDADSVTISQVTTIGHFCLCQPYALKERIIHAATQIIHHGNCRTEKGYEDHLITDPRDLSKQRWPTTQSKRAALNAVGRGRWKSFDAFEMALSTLNSKDFERKTMNYRTGANHLIPPHFEQGEGPFVTRFITAHSEMKANDHGSFDLVCDYNKLVPAYGFGGTPPLKVADAVGCCVEQHLIAKACYEALATIVEEIVAKARSSSA